MKKESFYNYELYEINDLSDKSFLYENLNEGLIRSYTIEDVKRWLENEMNFDCIKEVYVMTNNYYKSKRKSFSDNEFVEIILKTDQRSLLSYERVIKSCYCSLGWFTGIVCVKVRQRDGNYIPYVFERNEPRHTNKDFINRFYSPQTKYELSKFISANIYNICGMSLIIEEKFPIKQYLYNNDEVFYHKTDMVHLSKIRQQGLVPKSRFNFPSRIYLTNNIEDVDDMELYAENGVILKIHLNRNQKLYKDPRSSGFFTYENISPSEIEILNI